MYLHLRSGTGVIWGIKWESPLMAEVVIFLTPPRFLLYGEAAACLPCEHRSWFSSAGDWKPGSLVASCNQSLKHQGL